MSYSRKNSKRGALANVASPRQQPYMPGKEEVQPNSQSQKAFAFGNPNNIITQPRLDKIIKEKELEIQYLKERQLAAEKAEKEENYKKITGEYNSGITFSLTLKDKEIRDELIKQNAYEDTFDTNLNSEKSIIQDYFVPNHVQQDEPIVIHEKDESDEEKKQRAKKKSKTKTTKTAVINNHNFKYNPNNGKKENKEHEEKEKEMEDVILTKKDDHHEQSNNDQGDQNDQHGNKNNNNDDQAPEQQEDQEPAYDQSDQQIRQEGTIDDDIEDDSNKTIVEETKSYVVVFDASQAVNINNEEMLKKWIKEELRKQDIIDITIKKVNNRKGSPSAKMTIKRIKEQYKKELLEENQEANKNSNENSDEKNNEKEFRFLQGVIEDLETYDKIKSITNNYHMIFYT